MRKTSTRLILWFLIVITVTVGIVVGIMNKSVSHQFQNFIVATSEGQIDVVETFIEREFDQNGWGHGFDDRLLQLAKSSKMSLVLKNTSDETVFEYKYSDVFGRWKHKMPMRMHKEWDDDFEAFWPSTALRVLRDAQGNQIGMLELELHDLDDSAIPAMEFQRNMATSLLRSMVLAVGVSIVLGLILAKSFSRPLHDMKLAAHSMKSGDLNVRVNEKQKTLELTALAHSLNHLAQSLHIQQELRSRLASDLSHEIRTPLSILKSHLEAIRDGIWTMDDSRLEILLHETERLMNMAEQIRYIEDIESHDLKLNLVKTDMLEWMQDVVEFFRPEVEKQDKRVIVEGSELECEIDQDKFKQILFNLLSNAIQHTEAGDTVTLRVYSKAKTTILEVEDTGKGIDTSEVDHIFERLYRSEEARSRQSGGSGLGLAVVKSLVEAHGYSIEVESVLGKGTIMRIIMIK